MNDIEDNRERLRDLALQHIEPTQKSEKPVEEKVPEQMVEEEEDSDAPSTKSHETSSQRKYKRGGRKTNTFGIGDKTSEEFEYIQPTTTENNGEDLDASSVNEDGGAPTQRKHQRGGRKKKRSNRQDLESQKPWSQRSGRLRSPYPEEEEEPQTRQNPEEPKPEVPEKTPTPFETGLKHFNMRRAEHSGARPIGISVDRGETNGTHTKKEKKSKRKSKKSKKKGKKSKKNDESSSEDSSNKNSTESESEEEEKKQKQKPFAIRLDLNLEIEIFLRAKIKGEVTISFL